MNTAQAAYDPGLDQQEVEYVAEAQLGDAVERFLESDVGRYMRGRAKLEQEDAMKQLLYCNPYNFFGRRKIKRLQQKAWAAQHFEQWCAEAIYNGRNAAHLFENYGEEV